MGKDDNPELVLSVSARKLKSWTMFNAASINLETGVQEAGVLANYQSLEAGVSVTEELAVALSGKTVAPAAHRRFGYKTKPPMLA